MTNSLVRQVAFFAPAGVMSAWAVVMFHTIASGHINRLLSPMFRSYVVAAAVALLVLSLLHLLLYNPVATPADPRDGLRSLLRWLALLVPLVAAAVISPAALSSTTFNNRALAPTAGVTPMPTWSNTASANVDALLTANPAQPVPVDVMDLVTLSHTPDKATRFDGNRVRMVGFLVHPAGGGQKLLRWMMWCCAADAQPVSVSVSGNTAGNWKDTDWVEITGTAHFSSVLGQVIPQVEIDKVKPTSEPDEPYLSP